jgi:hypothetical protein
MLHLTTGTSHHDATGDACCTVITSPPSIVYRCIFVDVDIANRSSFSFRVRESTLHIGRPLSDRRRHGDASHLDIWLQSPPRLCCFADYRLDCPFGNKKAYLSASLLAASPESEFAGHLDTIVVT